MASLDNLTFGEIKQLVGMFGNMKGSSPSCASCEESKGRCLVVLDKGFVFLGTLVLEGEWVRVEDAQNVRVYGTAKGLGELALTGPTSKTVLDPCGTVVAPRASLVFFLPCKK